MDHNDLPLFNHPAAPHNGTDTSRDAAESIRSQINGMCRDVLEKVRRLPLRAGRAGQIEQLLGWTSGPRALVFAI